MNTLEKYEDIKVSMLQEKTRDTLEKLQKATKNFTIENDKAIAYVNAVHSKLSKEKPEYLRSTTAKPEPKPEPKKAEPKKPAVKKAVAKKAEPKKQAAPKPTPKPKITKTQIKTAAAKINTLQLAIQSDPLLQGLGKTDKERDASRFAQPKGRRVSKIGWKNQYGASKGGRAYYESRENRSDRKSPEYKSGYPYLEMGGYTHRLDSGMMADGGYTAKGEDYEYINTFKRFDSNVDVPNDDFKKFVDAWHKQKEGDELNKAKYKVLKRSMGNYLGHKTVQEMEDYVEKTHDAARMEYGGFMAEGGDMGKIDEVDSDEIDMAFNDFDDYAHGGMTKFDWEKAEIGDSALVIAENKMGVIVKTYGRRFHLRFPDGSDKTYSAEELKFFLDDDYAKGGVLKNATYVSNRNIDSIKLEIDKSMKDFKGTDLLDGVYVKKSSLTSKFDAYKSFSEFAELNNKIWDKNNIQSGGEIYASDSLQKKLAIEYANSGIDSKFKNLTIAQRKKVAEIMTDENEHSLRNYLALRGYLGQKDYDSYARLFEPKRPFVLNPSNFKNDTLDKVDDNYVVVSEKDEYWYIMSTPSTKSKAQQLLKMTTIPRGEIGKVVTIDEAKNHKKVIGKQYLSKTIKPKGIVVTSIKDIPNFDKRLDEGKITYRGLGMGKLSNDFFKETGTSGYRIKVDGKEYFITNEEFDTFSRGSDGKLRIRFAAPARKSYEQGGEVKSSEKLPYKLNKYFIKGDKTIEVPLSQLSPIRARETGIENAEKFMRMAYNGDMERRKPISIYLISKGKYKIADGNSTFAVAKKNGWKTIYADVIKNPKSQSNGKKSVFSIAKEIRKDGESWQSAIQRAKSMK